MIYFSLLLYFHLRLHYLKLIQYSHLINLHLFLKYREALNNHFRFYFQFNDHLERKFQSLISFIFIFELFSSLMVSYQQFLSHVTNLPQHYLSATMIHYLKDFHQLKIFSFHYCLVFRSFVSYF